MAKSEISNTIYHHEQIKTEPGLPVRFIVYEETNCFVPRHWHGSMEIIYILDGLMQVEDNDRNILLQKDDYIIINSRDIHSTRCINTTRVLLLQLPLVFLKSNIDNYDTIRFEGYEDLFKSPDQNEIRSYLTQMADLYTMKKEDGFKLAFNGLLYTLLYTLVRDYKRQIPQKKRLKTEKNLQRLDCITGYVEENYKHTLSVHDAASVIHVGDEYFCRYFKKYMGMTFLEYVATVRMNHIYEDLIHTDLSIMSILESHGFTNYKSFMRLFKKTYGMTPLQKRNETREAL